MIATITLFTDKMNITMKLVIYIIARTGEAPFASRSSVISWIESPRSRENRVANVSRKVANRWLLPKLEMPTITKLMRIGTNPIKCLPIFGKDL